MIIEQRQFILVNNSYNDFEKSTLINLDTQTDLVWIFKMETPSKN